ncbi:MAG: SDR family oxidoreductase [Deltaproteobacteria bacterium]|nr:SDR family oxidoreductase [Deltaproteobacteria bacterium]
MDNMADMEYLAESAKEKNCRLQYSILYNADNINDDRLIMSENKRSTFNDANAVRFRSCVVIGSSRGLGAALVDGLLERGYTVTGVARTMPDAERLERWNASRRYKHFIADISSQDGLTAVKEISKDLPLEPVCVIFNAASVETDVHGRLIDHDALTRVNSTAIVGLGNTTAAFQSHLTTRGGYFVGISSFSAFAPPFNEPRAAYPASKAYLDMFLRSLRIIWRDKVTVVTVHLGHLGRGDFFLSGMLVSDYDKTANKIITGITGKKTPREINYPFIYCLVYRYILSCIPDFLYIKAAVIFNRVKRNKT